MAPSSYAFCSLYGADDIEQLTQQLLSLLHGPADDTAPVKAPAVYCTTPAPASAPAQAPASAPFSAPGVSTGRAIAPVLSENPELTAFWKELEALRIGLSAVCLDFAQKLMQQGVLSIDTLKHIPIEQAKKVLETVKMTEIQIGIVIRVISPPPGTKYVQKVKHPATIFHFSDAHFLLIAQMEYFTNVYDGFVRETDQKFHGTGIMHIEGGNVLDCEWKDGLPVRGTLRYFDNQQLSAVFVGTFKGFARHKGKYTHLDGVVDNGTVYEGEFEDNLFSGRGKLSWPDGRVYEGEFKASFMHGTGKHTWPDGRVCEGEFIENKNARGRFTWPDGQVYEGEFKDYVMSGFGKLTFPNGSVYEGEFKGGLKDGRGTMTYSDGRREDGTWRDDNFISKSCSCMLM